MPSLQKYADLCRVSSRGLPVREAGASENLRGALPNRPHLLGCRVGAASVHCRHLPGRVAELHPFKEFPVPLAHSRERVAEMCLEVLAKELLVRRVFAHAGPTFEMVLLRLATNLVEAELLAAFRVFFDEFATDVATLHLVVDGIAHAIRGDYVHPRGQFGLVPVE